MSGRRGALGPHVWWRKVLSDRLSPQLRALLFMAANFAAMRLEQIVALWV